MDFIEALSWIVVSLLGGYALGLLVSRCEAKFYRQLSETTGNINAKLARNLEIIKTRLPKRGAKGRFVSSL